MPTATEQSRQIASLLDVLEEDCLWPTRRQPGAHSLLHEISQPLQRLQDIEPSRGTDKISLLERLHYLQLILEFLLSDDAISARVEEGDGVVDVLRCQLHLQGCQRLLELPTRHLHPSNMNSEGRVCRESRLSGLPARCPLGRSWRRLPTQSRQEFDQRRAASFRRGTPRSRWCRPQRCPSQHRDGGTPATTSRILTSKQRDTCCTIYNQIFTQTRSETFTTLTRHCTHIKSTSKE